MIISAALSWLAVIFLLFLKTQTVTHPGTNRARRALTSFIRRTPLTTTPPRQPAQRVWAELGRQTHLSHCRLSKTLLVTANMTSDEGI